ncbi:hypothetical protein PLICRDRAFT_29883 [Plicaturopsis crispa FD-325 SS-3]|nr:hypothetical protein PLICRDRAFT_29883 [Plicaturopsis crispa FD-325 SS-3]
MDDNERYQQRLFQSPQLPPLNPSFARTNTLPPLASSFPTPGAPSTSSAPRFTPISPYPESRDTRQMKAEPGTLQHGHERQLPQQQQQQQQQQPHEDAMPSTSDFVKKLYKMLEDPAFANVVSWGPQGDCFVVKDMNEFTKSILPRMFKHSNFASFVRQLNKYDFHKVKNTDDNQFGEHSWTFRHPDFHADRRDSLENIKRKVPTQRKPVASSNPTTSHHHSHSHNSTSSSPGPSNALQAQVDRLTAAQDEMSSHIRNLERNYQDVLVEMVQFQRNMAQQDGLMQNLIQYFLQVENGKLKDRQQPQAQSQVQSPSTPHQQQQPFQQQRQQQQQQQQQMQSPFLATQEAQRMMGGAYPESDVARASLAQMSEISRRAEVAGMSFGSNASVGMMPPPPPPNNNSGSNSSVSRIMAALMTSENANGNNASGSGNAFGGPLVMSRQDALARISELQRSRPASAQPPASTSAASPAFEDTFVMPDAGWGESSAGAGADDPSGGLQVFTLGHLMPKSTAEDGSGNWSFDPAALGLGAEEDEEEEQVPASFNGGDTPGASTSTSTAPAASTTTTTTTYPKPKLRVRRSTFVPGWAVPPRVLLVDDDAVSRKLSSKFLQVFGCTIDVAVDGVGAVHKMNLEKYDLVLMDIVMPKLDGVSATSMIRQFDHMTPIISMTSNSKPNEIMTYYSSGMNDILPKPFTKEGLLDMLERHLMHLKVVQQMAKTVPRSVGVPPLSDAAFEQALTLQAASNPALGDDDGRINPLAGMGLTDEQYAMILQGLVNGESFPGVGMPDASSPSAGDKRERDDGDARDGGAKRGRFEVVD